MKYYATYDESMNVLGLTKSESEIPGFCEISEEKFNKLFKEIKEKAGYTKQVYEGSISINQVPAEMREEVQKRVDDLKAQDLSSSKEEISDSEFVQILEGAMKT